MPKKKVAPILFTDDSEDSSQAIRELVDKNVSFVVLPTEGPAPILFSQKPRRVYRGLEGIRHFASLLKQFSPEDASIIAMTAYAFEKTSKSSDPQVIKEFRELVKTARKAVSKYSLGILEDVLRKKPRTAPGKKIRSWVRRQKTR